MIKKFIISIGVLFSFFLMFLLGFDKINVLAYSDIGNALGSYPIKLDVDNYNRDNLLDVNDFSATTIFSTDVDISFLANVEYYFCANVYTEASTPSLSLLSNTGTSVEKYVYFNNSVGYTCKSIVFDSNTNIDRIYFYAGNNYNNSLNHDFSYTDIMLIRKDKYKGYYEGYFKFGYNVNYSLAVNNLTSNQVNAGIAITDKNGNYLKTGSCVVPASSSTICSNLNDPLYLPFNIDNNGYISFDYSLGLFIGPVGYLSVTPSDSGFNFVPVFNAYYNGSPTDNLYFKDRFTFNNLFLSGFNVSVNSSTLSKVIFLRNQIDSEFSMNTNKLVNFATDKKIETGIYNYINYIDFINSNLSDIYSFVVTAGVSSPVLLQDRIFTISFSNLSLKVNGDSGNSSPLPINPNTINKYNECSAWYDIPCQLGNGLTYVIYEAPIISPVLTFIVSFITMFSSLVSFVDLFSSFGIVFGCFIIYMFVELLHKYSK